MYTEFYKDMQMILTFKEESANGDVGDPDLIFLANKSNSTDVLMDDSVILCFDGNPELYVILTFRDKSQANNFCSSLRGHFNADITVLIPRVVQQVLQRTHV